MTSRTFAVEGMSCAHCQAAVQKALRGLPGVASAEVDLARHEARVRFDERRVDPAAMARAVEDAGYVLRTA